MIGDWILIAESYEDAGGESAEVRRCEKPPSNIVSGPLDLTYIYYEPFDFDRDKFSIIVEI